MLMLMRFEMMMMMMMMVRRRKGIFLIRFKWTSRPRLLVCFAARLEFEAISSRMLMMTRFINTFPGEMLALAHLFSTDTAAAATSGKAFNRSIIDRTIT